MTHLDSILKKQRHCFANKGPSSQGYGFSSGHVWMWELDYKESWVPKNWYFWTVVLEKTFERPLDCKKIQLVHPKGDESRVFIGRTDAEVETPILCLPDVKNWLIWKDPNAGKDWRWEEKGMRCLFFHLCLFSSLSTQLLLLRNTLLSPFTSHPPNRNRLTYYIIARHRFPKFSVPEPVTDSDCAYSIYLGQIMSHTRDWRKREVNLKMLIFMLISSLWVWNLCLLAS